MESLALDAAKSITNVVAGSVFQEINLAWGFKDQLNKLKERLLDTQALMNDLASAEHAEKSQLVSRWIQKLKAVAYSAEDLMDDYAYEMLRRKHQGWDIIEGCRNFWKPSSNRIVFRTWMAHRIKQILSELDQLYTDPNIVGLQLARKAVSASTSTGFDKNALHDSRKHPTTSRTIGREHDVKKLLEMLLNPNSNSLDLPIIAISGIGGLGKTTLASKLFHHDEVDEQFAGKKAWICVSDDFNVDKILKEMVESLNSTSGSTKRDLTNTGAIIGDLQKELKGRKFFLVLDDIWNESKELWDSLKTELQRIGGLVVLITTRSLRVANIACTCASYIYKLEGLSEEEGWTLLTKQVFDGKAFSYDPSFDDVGKQIAVEKCKGVPLAIKSIGSVLHSKQHISDWISIKDSEVWNIKADDRNYLMPSLLLSYNHINLVNVRQCFAYCAIFPKDSVLEKGKLIALWLSQGLIHDKFEIGNSSATHEASGEECFDILVDHSFLQKENDDDYQDRYKMHDLVHDLATYVSMKELLVWNTKDKTDVVDSQFRHLVFNLQDDEIVPETPAKERMRKLRTISFWKGMPRWNSLICARNIRTLVMVDVGLIKVPSIIGQLVHLRYLDLSKNYGVKALPESICKLYQLQTLKLLYCYELEELPKKLHRLRNLRHIETSRQVYASRGLQKLTCLQTLPRCLGLRDGIGCTINELGLLNQVKGDVRISGLECVKDKEEARGAELWRKEKISNLKLLWGKSSKGHNDEVVLDGLEPHPNLQSLEIDGFCGVKFPTWIMTMNVGQSGHLTQLRHLTEVKLTNCRRCKQLPSLGQLSKLRILRLKGFDEVERIGEEFYGNNSNIGDIEVLFLELRELYFGGFKSVTTWMPPSPTPTTLSCFPNLETLEIESCPELERLPSLPLKSLKHVKLRDVGVNSLEVTGMNEIVSQREELSNCINLQTLKMINCEKVKWIHIEDATQLSHLTKVWLTNKVCKKLPSLGQLPKLAILRLEGFDEVECIGNEFYENSNDMKELFPTLRELFIREFRSLSSWVPPNLGLTTTSVFPKLETLEIDDCRLLETVPTLQFESLKNLKLSNIGGNQALDMIKGNPGLNSLTVRGMKEVERLPKELSNCIKLQKLEIEDCEKMKWIPSGIISLKDMRVFHCPSLESIEELSNCINLEKLNIRYCEKVKWIPTGIISLKELRVKNCPSVGSIEEGVLQGLSSLRELYIEECSGLSRLPKILEDCTSMETLSIEDCPLIEGEEEDAVPDIGKLQGLRELTLKNAGRMMAYLPRWIPQLHGLKELDITGWGEEWDMSLTSSLPSLTDMYLTNFPNLKPLVPERQNLLPPSLDDLTIQGFEEMEELPDWIGDLSSLQYLQLEECKKLKYLPSKQAMLRLSRLRFLSIEGCPLLEKRCDKRNGPEWPKISHLPTIIINGDRVQIEEGQKNRCWVI